MIAAFDARWVEPAVSGITRYCLEMTAAIARRFQEDSSGWRLLIIVTRYNRHVIEAFLAEKGIKETDFVRFFEYSSGVFSLSSFFFLGNLLRGAGAAVYHSPNYMAPARLKGIKSIVTIHDLIPVLFPEYTPRALKTRFSWFFNILIKRMARACDAVVTVSRNSAKDITGRLGADSENVHVIYNGVTSGIKPERPSRQECGEALKGVPETAKIYLYVGRFDPYKNITTIIHAAARLNAAEPGGHYLVVAGRQDTRYPEPFEAVKKTGMEKFVRFTGPVNDSLLSRLYCSCDALVIPSLYEGFCIPVVEAFSCGLPVVASRKGAIEEIAADAAEYVEDPLNHEELAGAMRKVCENQELRSRLIKNGRARSSLFSWDMAAQKTIQLYRSLCGQ